VSGNGPERPAEPEGPTEPERSIAPDGSIEPDKAPDAPKALGDSIYGETSTFFTTPKLNQGVPADPRFIKVLSAVEIAIGVVLFAFIVFGVMYQVLGRYFPTISWVGAGELALMSMVAMTFITTGYLVGRNGHIVLEIFDGLLAGTRLFVALRVISAVIMAATSLVLVYEAFVKIETEWGRLSAAMHLPLGVLYIFALIGFLSAAIHSVFKIPYANRPEHKLDIGEMEG
jgi:TRAP-type C4-dicarboxylate transport system permease small subunit